MSRKPFITSKDFSEAKQNFDQIPVVHVSYTSSYFALLQCNLVEHPIVDIWEDSEVFSAWGTSSPSYIKSSKLHTTVVKTLFMERITSSDAYHKATEWFLHHMNSLILFRRYTWSLDTLELNVLITFSFFIIIGEVCMLKFEMSLLGVNNVIN
jgi:hypothetical protein